jgi:hypothetical protein
MRIRLFIVRERKEEKYYRCKYYRCNNKLFMTYTWRTTHTSQNPIWPKINKDEIRQIRHTAHDTRAPAHWENKECGGKESVKMVLLLALGYGTLQYGTIYFGREGMVAPRRNSIKRKPYMHMHAYFGPLMSALPIFALLTLERKLVGWFETKM